MMDMSKACKALLLLLLLALLAGCGTRLLPAVTEAPGARVTAEVPPAPTPTPLLSPPPPVITPTPEVSSYRIPAGRHYPPQLPEDWREPGTAPAAETGAQPGTYTVRGGDCLWSIAEAIYGSGTDWRRLWTANRDTVEDPSLVLVGQVLQLPGESA